MEIELEHAFHTIRREYGDTYVHPKQSGPFLDDVIRDIFLPVGCMRDDEAHNMACRIYSDLLSTLADDESCPISRMVLWALDENQTFPRRNTPRDKDYVCDDIGKLLCMFYTSDLSMARVNHRLHDLENNQHRVSVQGIRQEEKDEEEEEEAVSIGVMKTKYAILLLLDKLWGILSIHNKKGNRSMVPLLRDSYENRGRHTTWKANESDQCRTLISQISFLALQFNSDVLPNADNYPVASSLYIPFGGNNPYMSVCVETPMHGYTLQQTWGAFIFLRNSGDVYKYKRLVHDILFTRRFMLHLGRKTNIEGMFIKILFHVSGYQTDDLYWKVFPPCTEQDHYTIERV
jgi:hypothetical protein